MAVLVPASSGLAGEEAPLATYLVAGCVSGAVASLVNTPTELVKIRQQAFTGQPPLPSSATAAAAAAAAVGRQPQPPGTWSLARSLWTTGGLRSLFRGFTPCILRDLGYGPYFLTYELLLRTISPRRPSSSGRPDLLVETEDELAGDPARGWWAVAVAGAVAGVVSWTATFPFDVIKTRMQASAFATEPAFAPATAGASSRLTPSFLPSSSSSSSTVGNGPRSPLTASAIRSFALSVPSSSSTTTLRSNPSPALAVNPFRTTWSTVRHAWRNGGPRSFYVGLAPTLLRAIPTNIATFSIVRVV
jgi:solute carrier family 25 carnitine/acylcarnitine transporter 20/29